MVKDELQPQYNWNDSDSEEENVDDSCMMMLQVHDFRVNADEDFLKWLMKFEDNFALHKDSRLTDAVAYSEAKARHLIAKVK